MAKARSRKLLLVIGITLLAAFFRLYKIDVLPPGETYDPAFYGLDALAILRGETPVFFETNYGREPLFSYLVAACIAVWGVGSQAIHIASAIVGILTVPAVYLAAEEVFSEDRGLLGRLGSLVAALALAVSYWHLNWSRYGVRAVLTPLFAAATMYLLWRGVRTKKWRAFVGCGFFLGLGMYTYQATRLLPLLVVAGFVYAVWANRSFSKEDAWHLTIVVVVALVVFAPLGTYFITHPDSFSERIDQVFVFGSEQAQQVPSGLAQELKEVLLVFSFHGDEKPTINIPGRPALNPFLSTVFALGVVISFARIRRPSYLLLLTWLGVMCVPGVLAQHGPTAKRIIGSLPAVMMLIAVGTLAPLDALQRWAARASSGVLTAASTVVLLVIVGGLLYSGMQTYRDYFVVWGQDPALFTHFEAGLAAIGQYIGERPSKERIYVSPVYVGHPSIRYNSRERSDVKGYHGQYCIVLPDQVDRDTTYIVVPGEDKRSLDVLRAYLPQGEIIGEGPLHYQQPYFLAYHVPAGAQSQMEPAHPLEVNWDDKIQLLGYDFAYDRAGGTAQVRFYYKALSKMETDYTVFVQLVGPHNPATDSPLWSQIDSEPCRRYRPTTSWDVDEVLIDEFTLRIPADMPEGAEYKIIAGFYDWQTLVRLSVLDTSGRAIGDHAILIQDIHNEGA